MGKIMTREEIAEIAEELKKHGKRVGFTSGAFDILHAGHASYLRQAREKCDCLIVGVNSDSSVKKYKGENRPIVPENERIALIAALESTDYAFLFDERRNKENIETIKPDIYIKAGDYKLEELTSAVYMKPWGGQVILIPPEEGMSTSSIIEKILGLGEDAKKLAEKKYPIIFLDRDGVINENIPYLHEPEKFKLLPGAIEGLKKMRALEYKLVITTNQGGIGLGYYLKEDFFKVNLEMLRQLSSAEVLIDRIYFCPHSQAEDCNCRKPKIGMLEKANRDIGVDLGKSFMIGDNSCDILAGKNFDLRTILITSKRADNIKEMPDYTAQNLKEAADIIENDRLQQNKNVSY